MAGPQSIQRYPTGLIDLLGMRATGDTPHEIANIIGGSIDLLNLYAIDRLVCRQSGTAIAIAALGYLGINTAPIGPPPGTLWLIYHGAISCVPVAAGATLGCSLVIRRQAGVNIYDQIGPALDMVATQGGHASEHFWDAPLLMRPGDEFGVWTHTFTGAPAVTPNVSWTYVEIAR